MKVKGKVSPFDPSLRDYWEDRRLRRLVREAGRFNRAHLLKQQAGRCAVCPRRPSTPTLISTTPPTSWCVVIPPPGTSPASSSTAGAVQDGIRRGGRATRWQMLEPYAGQLARTVLRGPGRSQDFPAPKAGRNQTLDERAKLRPGRCTPRGDPRAPGQQGRNRRPGRTPPGAARDCPERPSVTVALAIEEGRIGSATPPRSREVWPRAGN